MKVVVYAICKNESKFVDRWVDSMREADEIVVLDTGSTDHTQEQLEKHGVKVYSEIISPWRFDVARNRSLALVPEDADICVCTDLDEMFQPGWRKALEDAWQPETQQARYRYTWNFREDGREGVVFWIEKVHARHGFVWKHPVHEVLEYTGSLPYSSVTVSHMQLDHHADPSKSRGQYLPLLELSVQEAPEDDRNMHYLGREYMFYGRWDDCINTLQKHLKMPSAKWPDERAASMRYIAKAFCAKGEREQARRWLYRAIAEAPHLREAYVEMSQLCNDLQEWEGTVYFAQTALKIQERPQTYICTEEAWGSLPYDLLTLGYYYSGRYLEALAAVNKAVALDPENQRLISNKEWVLLKCEEKEH